MGSKIDIESYLSKRDPGLGRAIRIVRAAKGPSGHPPPRILLLSRHSFGPSSTSAYPNRPVRPFNRGWKRSRAAS
jgi:hypothetical protein